VVLTVSATAITAFELDSKALNSIFSAMGFQTPKFCGEDMIFNIKDQEINVSEIILNRTKGRKILKRKKKVG
jgi:hypothetical protein